MRYFVALLFLVLLFAVPSPLFAHTQIQVIKMTKDGFEPQDVTVDSNQTVIFTNQDDKERWPASNVHPTHELYPQFDPKGPIKIGGSWTFSPKNPGEWKYHDHLFPHLRGTVVVGHEGNLGPPAQNSQPPLGALLSKVIEMWSNFSTWMKTVAKPKQTNVLGAADFSKLSSDEQIKYLND